VSFGDHVEYLENFPEDTELVFDIIKRINDYIFKVEDSLNELYSLLKKAKTVKDKEDILRNWIPKQINPNALVNILKGEVPTGRDYVLGLMNPVYLAEVIYK
jgi:hypothetical protein